MKYIRTKNGIYDLNKSIWCEFTGHKVIMPYCEEYEKQPELCKTADTIEELCDFAYTLWDDNSFEVYELSDDTIGFNDFVEWLKSGNVLKVYYGIITDKGLIYVAKMNEKGELELI